MRTGRGRGRGSLIRSSVDSGLGGSDNGTSQSTLQPVTETASAQQFEDVREETGSTVPRQSYAHKMPLGGDQGVKPVAEKSWPTMWHDKDYSGPSPMSVSGRFQVMPNGSEIPMHKKKNFSFSGRKKVANHDEKEAEQRLALNLQLQAPPRKLPEYVYDDFMKKGRNVNQLLNEFIQHRRMTITWKDVPSNESFKNYGLAAVVNNFQYPPGSAWKKQLAKEAAAKNALKELLLEYYKSEGDVGKVQALEDMDEEAEKISREVDHPTRFKPQAKLTKSRADASVLEAQHINERDQKRVVKLVASHMQKLGIDSYCGQFAAYVLIYRGRLSDFAPRVVALATGDNVGVMENGEWIRKKESVVKNNQIQYGRVLNDTSAITLARRGMLRFLLDEAEKFYEKQMATQFEWDSIFKMDPESNKLILSECVEFVLVLSDMPSCVREDCEAVKINNLPEWQAVRASDKLAKWSVTGLQGAIGSRVMEPIYCSGIVLATNDTIQAIQMSKFFARVLSTETLQQSGYLPGVYMPFRPSVVNCDPAFLIDCVDSLGGPCLRLPERDESENIECLEWCAQYPARPSKLNRIDAATGYAKKKEGLTASRLSKMALFTIFKRVLEKRRLGGESVEATYAKAKKLARDYRKCKRWIYHRFMIGDEGTWVVHPDREIIENIYVAPKRN